jgi:hypothetical protein
MRTKLTLFLALLINLVNLINFVSPPPAFAQPTSWAIDECYVVVGGVEVATIQGIECIFKNVSKTIVPFAGLAVFITLIAGSLQLLTSAGNPKTVEKAWKTITFAVIGIVVIVGIWFVLTLIKTITGIDVTKFEIPK